MESHTSRPVCQGGPNNPPNGFNMKENTFPFKTYRMIDHCSRNNPEAASWSNDGQEFVLRDSVALETKYLPQFFMNRSKFSSFIRQLNMYGFRNVTSETNSSESKGTENKGGQHVIFRHDSFREGRPDLLDGVQRSRTGDHTQRKQRENEALKNTTASLSIRIGRVEDKVEALNDKMDQVLQKLDNLFDIVAGGNCATCSCTKSFDSDTRSKRHKRDASVLIRSSDILDDSTSSPVSSLAIVPQHSTSIPPAAPQLPQNQPDCNVTYTSGESRDKHYSGDATCVPGRSFSSQLETEKSSDTVKDEMDISNGFFFDLFTLKGCNVFPEDKTPTKHTSGPSSDSIQQDKRDKDKGITSKEKISSEIRTVHQEKDPEAGKSDPCRAADPADDFDLPTLPDIDLDSLDGIPEEKNMVIPLIQQGKPLGGFMRQHQRVALSTAFIMIAVAISLGFARPHVRHGQDTNGFAPSASPSLSVPFRSIVPSPQPTKNIQPTSIVITALDQFGPVQDPQLVTKRGLQSEGIKNVNQIDALTEPTESIDSNSKSSQLDDPGGWRTDSFGNSSE